MSRQERLRNAPASHLTAAIRSVRKLAFIVPFVITLCTVGCSWFASDTSRGYSTKGSWNEPVILTTSDVRIITKRKHPVTDQWVVCTEPSPDVAKALSTAMQLSAKGGNTAVTGTASVGGSSAESAIELAGRTTALLALRDGLYRTCEAYANGALGADAYALVLARYGQLMTTLFIAQDIASAARASTESQSSTVQAANSAPAEGSAPKAKAGKVAPAAKDSGPAADGAPAPSSAPTASQVTSAANAGSGISGVAAALARMNEDYFDLDRDLLQLLIVSCVNNGDMTRQTVPTAVDSGNQVAIHQRHELLRMEQDVGAKTQSLKLTSLSAGPNLWLTPICSRLMDLSYIQSMASNEAKLNQRAGHPALPIDSVAAIASSKKPPASDSSRDPESSASPSITEIKFAQKQVARLATPPLIVDGVLGERTVAALRLYQKQNHLAVTGELDPQTFSALLLNASK